MNFVIVTLEMFQWAKSVIDAWEAQEHRAALDRADATDDVVYFEPPAASWEWRQPDWSAA